MTCLAWRKAWVQLDLQVKPGGDATDGHGQLR